jgi:hypothetical protein
MKSKFKRIKAQAGAFTNAVNLDEGAMSDALMDWQLNMQGASPVNPVLSKDNIPVTDVYDSQGRKIGTTDSSGNIVRTDMPNRNGVNPSMYVDAFNATASAVTGVANAIQNNKLKKKERQDVLHSLEPRYWQNMEAEGLNNLPMYTKYGGKTKYKTVGKKQTGGSDVSADLRTDWNNYVTWLEQKGVKGSPELDKNNTGFKYLEEYRSANPNTLLTKEAIPKVQGYLQEYRNWVIESHKNKTRPIEFKADPGKDYELFMPNLSKVDGYPGQFTTSYKFPQEFLNARPIGYASIAQQKQTGGDVDEIYGLPASLSPYANVEAEAGEVMEMQNGGITKIADDANTHEQGGEKVAGVKRVLEDTARKRKDPASKMLLVEPEMVEQVFGFRPKTATSHSKVFQLVKDELAKTNKMYTNANKTANMLPELNKSTMNSLRLNDMFQGELPTEDEVFDLLFNHQEGVKMANQIQDDGSMAKYGGRMKKAQTGTGISEYKGGRTKSGSTTPAGNPNAFNFPGGLEAFKKEWSPFLDLSQYKTVAEAQAATYEYLVKNQPDVAASIWQNQGLTAKGRKLIAKDPKLAAVAKEAFNADGTLKQGVKLTPEQLSALSPAYADNMLGVRSITPSQVTNTTTEGVPGTAPVQETKPKTVLDPRVTINPNFVQQPENNFYEPTYWSDIAAPLAGFVGSFRRDPELYSPQTFHQLRYKLLDPTAALTANQADFNAAVAQTDELTGSGMSAASKSGLLGQKYRANNQVMSQYDQQNAGIKNNEITYNTQVRDKQSAADSQSRQTFYRNVQFGREAQRQQFLTSLGQLSRVDQLKRRQNNSGNLIMKLSPAFDQFGEYNGYQYVPYLDPSLVNYDETTVKPGKPATTKSKTKTTTTFKDAAGRTIKQVTD